MKNDRILGFPWAIMPQKLQLLAAEGILVEENSYKHEAMSQGSIMVLPVYGVITQKSGFWGTSTDAFGEMFDEAVNNPSVKVIALDIDSPGGEMFGVAELADKIYNARDKKKIIAVSNSLMASAAYWIGSSAHEIVATPSSITGSIGVIAIHEEISKMAENVGAKFTIIKAGEHKADNNPYEPLTDGARGEIQSRVDYYYDMFTESVGRNRGITANQVKKSYGDGRVFNARTAKELGVIDRVDTLEGVIDKQLAKMAKAKKNRNLSAMY